MKYFPVFFVAIFLLTECSKHSDSNLSNKYRGTHSNFAIEIVKDSIKFVFPDGKSQGGTYKISAENNETADFEATIENEVIKFHYEKAKSSLQLLQNGEVLDIFLPKDKFMKAKIAEFAEVTLTTDLTKLTEKEKQMLPLLFEAAQLMDDIFWKQTFGDKEKFLNSISDPDIRRFAEINYGPWERLGEEKPFVEGFNEKPKGANFYPADITKEEFDALRHPLKTSQYSIIVRNAEKKLDVLPYSVAFKAEVEKAAELLKKAAALAEDAGLKKYLELRAAAFLSNNYFESDMAWMDMKTNTIDFVVGPIENYEDGLFGIRAAHEGAILIKDKEWSGRLSRFAALLPKLQESLPVDAKYKKEKAGTNSDLGAYDIICYAGDCNSGGKTIAINLPNDENVQLKKGSRRLQLKNAMKAKFDNILVPIANAMIAENQRKNIKFECFFENVMLHETAHGIGIKNTITGKGNVRDALKEQYSAIEEAKADILGLFLVQKLTEMGEFKDKDLMDNFVTFLAGIFRSVRFGATEAHGISNMIQFYYFEEAGAFSRDEKTGLYSVNFEKMKEAVASLGNKILVLQGDGNYEGCKQLVAEKGKMQDKLQKDLNRITKAGIPRDIIFKQGKQVLGL